MLIESFEEFINENKKEVQLLYILKGSAEKGWKAVKISAKKVEGLNEALSPMLERVVQIGNDWHVMGKKYKYETIGSKKRRKYLKTFSGDTVWISLGKHNSKELANKQQAAIEISKRRW